MATGERFVKGEDSIIKKYWGAIPNWRMMMYEFHAEGYDRTLSQIQRHALILEKRGRLPKKLRIGRRGVAVRCVETGEEFKSITEAAKKFSTCKHHSICGISEAIKDKNKKAFKMHWELCTPPVN